MLAQSSATVKKYCFPLYSFYTEPQGICVSLCGFGWGVGFYSGETFLSAVFQCVFELETRQ